VAQLERLFEFSDANVLLDQRLLNRHEFNLRIGQGAYHLRQPQIQFGSLKAIAAFSD